MQKEYPPLKVFFALLGLAMIIIFAILGANSAVAWGSRISYASPLVTLGLIALVVWATVATPLAYVLILGGGIMAGMYSAEHWPNLDASIHILLGLGVTVLGVMAYGTYQSMPRGWLKDLIDAWEKWGEAKPEEAKPVQKAPEASRQPVKKSEGDAFSKLVGVESAVEAIKDALELPIKYPDKVKVYGIKPSRGILLYGPPGTGKTSLAKATAKYFNCAFWVVNATELLSPWVGQSEQALREIFAQARAKAPSVIFFDEIDAIGQRRDGRNLNRASDILLNQLLAEMDGFRENDGVFIMAATNRPDVLDEALLRPGRFDQLIEVPLPDAEARKRLFQLYLAGKPLNGAFDWDLLAEKAEGRSPAYIEALCRQATVKALKREVAGGERGIMMSDLV